VNDSDSETFARLAERLSQIEVVVKDPPPRGPMRQAGVRMRATRAPILPSIAGLALIIVVAALAPLIVGGGIGPSRSSLPGVAGGSPAVQSVAATDTVLVPLDPSSPPEELVGPCLSHSTVFDRAITTVEQDASASTAVVVGTVVGIGRAQWNTADGLAPERPSIEPSRVLRLLRVEVETIVKGTAPTVATTWIPGGVIGCHRFEMGGYPPVEVGSRYVFFINASAPRTKLEGVLGVWQMWSVVGDRVNTAFEGRLPLATFIERASG